MAVRALCAALLALASLATAGCGGDDESSKAPQGALNVYVSVPGHGPTAATGRAVAAGARQALREAGGRAGARRIRLVGLSSNRPGDQDWDPGTVEANAKRAADDKRAIAYIGEVDRGASAVSVPRTNKEGLLQVAPVDGLTSLTRRPPGRPRAGPERYYPGENRTFMRLVPPDARVAREMVALARPAARRRIALVDTADFAPRELGAVLDSQLRRERNLPVAHQVLKSDPDAVQDAVRELAVSRPDVVLVSAEPGPVARVLLTQLARQLPGAKVVTSPAMVDSAGLGSGAVAVTTVLPVSGGRAEARYGYDAMRTVLRAVREGGGDRAAVARAALRPRRATGRTGAYEVVRGGDVVRGRVALVPLDGGRARIRPLGP